MSAALWGLMGGLATVGISEALARWRSPQPAQSVWKALLWGALARAAWVLGLLALVLANGWLDAKAFTIALLAGYLAGQVFEGFRYRRLLRIR